MQNVEFRLGDMEEIPIAAAEVDLVFFSQSLHHALHPDRALKEAFRILAPGGRIVVLDLLKHRFEEARELYADEWLGFSEADVETMLEKAGFIAAQIHQMDGKESTGLLIQFFPVVLDKFYGFWQILPHADGTSQDNCAVTIQRANLFEQAYIGGDIMLVEHLSNGLGNFGG